MSQLGEFVAYAALFGSAYIVGALSYHGGFLAFGGFDKILSP